MRAVADGQRGGRGCDALTFKPDHRRRQGHTCACRCADHGLGGVGLMVFLRVGASHQRALGVGEGGLPCGRRVVLGRHGRATTPAGLCLVGGPLGLGFGAGRRVGLILRIGCLGARRQRGDATFGRRSVPDGGERGTRLLRPVVAQRADPRSVGVARRAVDRHRAESQQAALPRQRQPRLTLRRAARDRPHAEAPERHRLDRRPPDIRHVTGRRPLPRIRRQQQGLVPAERHDLRRGERCRRCHDCHDARQSGRLLAGGDPPRSPR